MKIVGLTGGIGSGKSTVSNYLKHKGCLIIDADEISRAVTGPGGPALEPILLEFGVQVFNEDGTLNRKAMSDLVFSDEMKKRKLEDIVVTMVINEFHAQIAHLKAENFKGIVVFDAPLLFEFGLQQYVDESWFVTASIEIRVARVVKRDGITREEVMNRIENQMPSYDKERLADYTINNSLDTAWLFEQVDRLLYRLKAEEGIE